MPSLPALGLPAPAARSRPSRRSTPPSAAATVPSSTAASAAPFSGADFVRPHLRTLAAYTPILPFDVMSAQLGRAPADIIKLDANENPYGPPPGAWRGGVGGWQGRPLAVPPWRCCLGRAGAAAAVLLGSCTSAAQLCASAACRRRQGGWLRRREAP